MKIYFSSIANSFENLFDILNPKYITSIDFTYFNSDNIDSFSYLFKDFERLTLFDINTFEGMISMEGLIQNCKSLKSVDLSKFDFSQVRNINKMFIGCDSLKTLYIPWISLSQIQNVDSLFNGNENVNVLWNTLI